MLHLPFILLSDINASLMEGQAENVAVRISIDGDGFNPATNAAEEFAPGYYCIELTDSELDCEHFVIVEITCTGAQRRVFSYTPEGVKADAQAIAAAVWNHRIRKLTSEVAEIIEPNTIGGYDGTGVIEPNSVNLETQIIEPNAEGDNLELRVIE